VQDPADTDRAHFEKKRLVEDLQRRIEELTLADESTFGPFTTLDWILCVGGFVLLPYLVYLRFWP
jgi:hypothetical protein